MGEPESVWEERVKLLTPYQVNAQAMALTDSHLFVAGAPDVVEQNDPWGAYADRKGGVLEVYSKEDGKKVATYRLASTPIYDGLAAARGRVFISTRNGSIVCMK